MTRRAVSLAALAVALGVLGVGIARAVDIGDTGSPSAAAKGAHNRHAGGGSTTTTTKTTPKKAAAEDADHNKHDPSAGGAAEPGEHDKHALAGPPPAALDNGSYVLRMKELVVPVGTRRFSFHVLDAKSGEPVTKFQDDLTKKLHLIVVRQDLTGFQHVHPRLTKAGEWIVEEAVLMRPGPWRFIADFIPVGGKRAVLAASVHATGGAYRVSAPKESPRAGGDHVWRTRVGAYTVVMEAVGYDDGGDGELRFAVLRGGEPVTDLQPYLGARGHTVLLRWGDVAYVHVHPVDKEVVAGRVDFAVTYPRVPPLKVFFQFRHAGKVRTAVFGLPLTAP